MRQGVGAARGAHDPQHPAAPGKSGELWFQTLGWSGGAMPANDFHLAHDRELGAEAFRQCLVFGGGRAYGLFQYREGACLQGIHGDLKILGLNTGGDHNDGRWPFGHDPLSGFKSIHARQPDVHGNDIRENDIRRSPVENAQCFFRAAHGTRDFKPRILPDDVFEELPNHLGVFDDQDTNLFHQASQNFKGSAGWRRVTPLDRTSVSRYRRRLLTPSPAPGLRAGLMTSPPPPESGSRWGPVSSLRAARTRPCEASEYP